MGRWKSAIVTRESVFHHELADNHDHIAAHYGITDNWREVVRVDFYPQGGVWEDLGSYRVTTNQDHVPHWWDDERRWQVEDELRRYLERKVVRTGSRLCLLGGDWILCGDAQLEHVTGGRVAVVTGGARIQRVSGTARVLEVCGEARLVDVYGSAVVDRVRGGGRVCRLYGQAQVGKAFDGGRVEEMSGGGVVLNREVGE